MTEAVPLFMVELLNWLEVSMQPGRLDLGCLLTSNQLTLTLLWVNAKNGKLYGPGKWGGSAGCLGGGGGGHFEREYT